MQAVIFLLIATAIVAIIQLQIALEHHN